MRVDAISIPAAAQAASTAAKPASSAPSSFSATLASSIRSSAPEHHQDQSAAAEKAAKSDSKVGAAAGAKSGASLNTKAAAKSNAKSDDKLAVSSATAPEAQPLLPTYPLSASLPGALLTTSLTTSVSTSPTTSPTLAKTAAVPQPLSNAQPGALMGQIVMSPTFPLSSMPNASSPQDQPGSTATSAVPLAVISRAGILPASNFSKAIDVLPANPGAANVPVNAPAPTDANSKSAQLPCAVGNAASDSAHSFADLPTRGSTTQAHFATFSASVLPTPTVLASLTPASLIPVTRTPVSPATTTATSTAPSSVDSQFQAPIPTGPTILALDQSPIIQSSSVVAAPFSPAPVAPAELLTQPALSSLLKNSAVQPKDQPVPSPAYNPSPVVPTNSAFNTFSPTSSAPAPAPIPTQQSSVRDTSLAPVTEGANAKRPAALEASDSKVGSSISPTSSAPTAGPIPTLQSPVRDINPAPVTQPANTKPPGAAKSSDSKAGNSTPENSKPDNSTPPRDLIAAESAPTSSSATLDSTPAQALSSDATTTVAAQNSASNKVSSVAPNLTPSSAAPVATAASIAAAISDAPGSGKPGVSVQPVPAAAAQATGPYEKSEKKSFVAVPPAATPSHDAPSHAIPLRDVPATLASGKDSSATLSAPAPTASAPPPQVASGAAPEPPKTHQMLDSAPPVPSTPPIAPDPAAAAQINAQMHVGIRTEAFGAVEIHAVVQQSQVGITVHADRDIAHWFSSELPGLESGLNKTHLNLTAVDFDNGRSGVQTATSSQHGQPQQHFSETPGSQSATQPEQNLASESAAAEILPSDLSVGPAQTHVSIHV